MSEKALNFAKNQIVTIKKTKNDKRIKIIELPVPNGFPVTNPKVRVKLPKWCQDADFDVIEIGKEVLKSVKKRNADHLDQSDLLVNELEQDFNKKSGRTILNDEKYDLSEILEEFGQG
jgi:type II secretory pathway component GspD/PulD (secretin)